MLKLATSLCLSAVKDGMYVSKDSQNLDKNINKVLFPNSINMVVSGRLMHHLKEVEGMSLRTVEYCVFDEADRLFEMGFAAQLREILAKMNESRQVSIWSSHAAAAAAWPCFLTW